MFLIIDIIDYKNERDPLQCYFGASYKAILLVNYAVKDL